MKKILALLCAFLLLLSTAALAEGEPVVTFRDLFQLNGTLPEGYRFSLLSQSDNTLEGEILSDDPAAPKLKVYIAFNETYADKTSLKDLGDEALEIIKKGFSEENEVTFETFDTASGSSLLMIRETGSDLDFLDFYTVCLGHEIELTLCAGDEAAGHALTDAQITRCTELMRSLEIVPLR